ncbi:AAA family ATPase [uncultured Alistipes sp.]|uniref:AAA family ATPase n=1 Tax=uncultured Alistipes sp. TaxID=538949 RepID=UPI0025888839|nr:AAA family ATPase [uncultured Alistipes sp.]
MANLHKINEYKKKLENYDINSFVNADNSFLHFLQRIQVTRFRHVKDLDMSFDHPVSVIAGTNKIGKTSILLLVACSFEEFWRYDSTKPETDFKHATWRDVISFTKNETDNGGYSYQLWWRIGTHKDLHGIGKRNTGARKSWTGLGKSSHRERTNAKIKERHVRFIDLERMLPARDFTRRLNYKASIAEKEKINDDITSYFCYILDIPDAITIYQTGSHINKRAFLIEKTINDATESYSSYNAASGEEALLNILIDIEEAPKNSLILIDELECGIHPNVQRKLADVIQYIAWTKKQQFIITTHSATLLSAFPQKSRKLIDVSIDGKYCVISKPAVNTVFSKMDSEAHPLITLYCEDDLAKYIIRQMLVQINTEKKHFDRLINIVTSGAINEVNDDYKRHKRNFNQFVPKKGYCCVFDGDYQADPKYSTYNDNNTDFAFFLYPYTAPEKFLIEAYLQQHPNGALRSFMRHEDHHNGFKKMAELGLATEETDARNRCWNAFKSTPDYTQLFDKFKTFIFRTIEHFSNLAD